MSYKTRRRVEFRDTDAAGIAHFSVFFTWMESAEHETLRALGLSVMPDSDDCVSWPRVSANCDFQTPIHFEDEVDIEVSVQRLGDKSVTYSFRVTLEDKKVAEGTMTSVCCQLSQGRIEPIKIPPDIRSQLQALVDDDASHS